LIQGSGADMAKQAMIDYAHTAEGSRLLMSLHDELIISVEEDVVERESKKLEHAMIHAFTLDVPLIAEAKVGNNFAEVK
jgi:DNA polymerase-1